MFAASIQGALLQILDKGEHFQQSPIQKGTLESVESNRCAKCFELCKPNTCIFKFK